MPAGENTHVIEYSLKLDSNPEFTGSVLVACARACWRMACAGETGCRTIFDIAPALLSPMTPEELRAEDAVRGPSSKSSSQFGDIFSSC